MHSLPSLVQPSCGSCSFCSLKRSAMATLRHHAPQSPIALRAEHSAWSAAGLGFLSLWLAGKLRCFGSNDVRPGAIVLSLLPLLVAGWMGLIRVQAYK